MERLKNIIKCRKGSSMIYGIVFLLFLGVIFLALFQKEQLNYCAEQAQLDITTTLTATGANMLTESYAPIRDGTSGSHVFGGISFTEIKDTSKFIKRYTEIYNQARADGSSITKYQGETPLFQLKNIRLYVENGGQDRLKSRYYCRYDLIIYTDLLWKDKEVHLSDQRQMIEYKNKF